MAKDSGSGSGKDKIAVIGGGTMGRGIAQAAARRGLEVLLIEKDPDLMERSISKISNRLDREIARWAMTESDKKLILSRITGGIDTAYITDERYIIEAVPEVLEQKREVFRDLDQYSKNADSIFITNTSTFSITELASEMTHSNRVIGMHFLNPVQKSQVVELVRGLNTSQDTFNKASNLAKRLERTAIEVFESPGYVTTRVMMPLVNEAIQVLMEGVASAEDIDTAIKLGYELTLGPLEMADEIGLDSVLSWLETLFHDLGDMKYRPCPLLRMLVRAGNLGVKTGRGFFRYDDEGNRIPGSGQTAASFERFFKEG